MMYVREDLGNAVIPDKIVIRSHNCNTMISYRLEKKNLSNENTMHVGIW